MNLQTIYHAISPHFRRARMLEFARRFEICAETRILDVGGTRANWALVPVCPKVICLNLDLKHAEVVANGCCLPFRSKQFDIVFSNSVIEHVPNSFWQRDIADEIRRVSRRYYVQTPDYWFPIEPHLLAPFVHWLPERWRHHLVPWTPAALMQPRLTPSLREVHLLQAKQVQALFPDAELWFERFCGLSKSLIAVRL